MNNEHLNETIQKLVTQHRLDIENFTEGQLVELIRQMITSGDIVRYTQVGSDAQSVSYHPFRERERLERMLAESQAREAKLREALGTTTDALTSIAAEQCIPSFEEKLSKVTRAELISVIDTDTKLARQALNALKATSPEVSE